MVKILVVGDMKGHHRSQIFLQALMHKDMASDNNFALSFVTPGLYENRRRAGAFLSKALTKLRNSIASLIFVGELLVKVPFANAIYLMAMNHRLFLKVYVISRIWRKPLVCDLYISIYDAAENRGLTRTGFLQKLVRGNFVWYLKMLDRVIIERSSKLIYVNRTELELVGQEVGANLARCDYAIIAPASRRKRIAHPVESATFRICWWGTFTPFHGVDNIIKAAALMNDKGSDFRLDLFGTPKHDSSVYERLTAELGLRTRVSFHKDKTFGNGKLEEYLCDNCDLALGNFSDTDRARRGAPTKILDAFSMQLPVISMDTKVLREYADVENELFVCSESPGSLADTIQRLMLNREELARRAKNGYAAYEARFSPEAVQKKFVEAIRSV